jgi:hypothetical protein
MPTTNDVIKRLLMMVTYYEIGENKRVGDEHAVRSFLKDADSRLAELAEEIESIRTICGARNFDIDNMVGLRGGPG